MKTEKTGEIQPATCCVIGCGPAGAMLGLMLAREGVDVLVLEKHADFLRDFRGDTIHPSTMEIMDELGLAEGLLELEHTKAPRLEARLPGGTVTVADFRRLRTRYPYITFMPQWDFLDYVTGEAQHYPNFRLEMNAEAKELILEDGTVRGVRYETARRSPRGAGAPHGRRRRTVLSLQRAGRPEDGQDLSAHRRALVQALAAGGRPRGYLRVRRRRALHGRHKPRRILADRLRDPERRVPERARRRARSIPAVRRRDDTRSRRSYRGAAGLGGCEASIRAG